MVNFKFNSIKMSWVLTKKWVLENFKLKLVYKLIKLYEGLNHTGFGKSSGRYHTVIFKIIVHILQHKGGGSESFLAS